ncbi:hypothetical protein EZJ55_04825 [Microcystis aeruginosa EAWAG127a]|jgi:hypothetical protein|uniref:Uncharacterized protein n=1 Tax=Microcystis aeruginosa EAWAG127a TaxID=2529855 RepID=A0A5J5LQL4_MICAE|nr:hypothetical protein [Microcystis aeruginosa]KAB0240024.1 hypothetical protein EZJ55_04825 [Microcystis aeruginosa EAWAG127a]MDB9417982.1 hypothetical protein [Microcystis aeruginosa CS-556/03]
MCQDIDKTEACQEALDETLHLLKKNFTFKNISREAQLFVGWVSGSVNYAGVGFNASTQPTFFSSLSGMGEQREIVAGWGWSGRERSALLRWRRV